MTATRRAYAASSETPSERTRNDIHKLLTKNGATHFGYLNSPDEDTVGFEMEGRRIKLVLPLPSREDDRVIYTDSGRFMRTPKEQVKAYEQLIRSRWRALYLVIKAKIEAVALGISTFEDEFLSGTVLPNQQTVSEYLQPQIARVYMTGKMPDASAALNAGQEERPESVEAEFVETTT
jgi:hypothetical protein